MLIARWGRFWAVYEGEDLVCVCVYRKRCPRGSATPGQRANHH
jgi:hypothetical protein